MTNKIALCKVDDYVEVSKLKPHPENPRSITTERLNDLKNSIMKKGFYQPILVWSKNYTVLSGNHRLVAVKELIKEGYIFTAPDGETQVLPVVLVNVPESMAKAILFESNATYANWIEDKLAEALKQADDAKENLSDFGFEKDYVDLLLKSALREAEDSHHDTDGLGDDKFSEEDLDELGDSDGEFESLILPRPEYEKLTKFLDRLSKYLDPKWSEGDSYAQAVSHLLKFAEASDMFKSSDKGTDERSTDRVKKKKAK